MQITYIPLKALSSESGLLQFTKRSGQKLDKLRHSIVENGLLHPLRVTPNRKKFSVLDGKKRLQVLKALSRSTAHSASCGHALTKIPCILETFESAEGLSPVQPDRPLLLSAPELAHLILVQARKNVPLSYIAQRYECEKTMVLDCLTLPSLNKKVLKAFYDGIVTLEQAAALSTIPNPKAQWDLLLQLGPFVSNTTILKAIRDGETVLDLPDGNIIILPSRKRLGASEFDSPAHNCLHKKTIAA